MQIARILIDEDAGGRSCIQILPKECNDPSLGTTAEVVQCTGLMNCQGCAMIRIDDPNEKLQDFCPDRTTGLSNYGMYTIDRVSKTQLTAIVRNTTCEIAEIVIKTGCFISSAVRMYDKNGKERICWTVVGTENESIPDLIKRMKSKGYDVEENSEFSAKRGAVLTNKQEQSIRLAMNNGYYEVPRKIDIRELCKEAGVSRTTFDVSLRTAEKKIISDFLSTNRDNMKFD